MKKEQYPSKQHCNPVIHQQFREATTDATTTEGHKANQRQLFQAVKQEIVRKWQAPGR